MNTANQQSDNASSSQPLLAVRDLSISLHEKGKDWSVVDSISYDVYPGEILGIVGESGCGKSVTNLSIMGLLPDALFVSHGSILFDGKDLTHVTGEERSAIDGSQISMIYQEPLTSLNPLLKIGRQVGEPLRIHHKHLTDAQIRQRSIEALTEVGLPDPEGTMDKYPHQLSGGMRQRVMIAMAIICQPQLVIADEPTTALDVTVQAQVLRLMKHINRKYGMSVIFISHDLAVIQQICDRVIVMYAGKIVESAPTAEIMHSPVHEYTKGLMRSIPREESKGHDLPAIPGHVPSTTEHRDPCPFAPRCCLAQDICRSKVPPAVYICPDHVAYCHMIHDPGAQTKEGRTL